MKKLFQISGTLVLIFVFSFGAAQAATILFPGGGGTGWGFPGGIQAHTILIGNGTNPFSTTSPSTSGYVLTSNGVNADPTFQPATGGGGSGNVATSSSETKGYLPYWTSTGATPATLGKIATSSVSSGTGISFTGTAGALVGGTNLTVSLDNTGNWAGTWQSHSPSYFQVAGSYLTSVTADSPLTGSGTSGSHLSIPAANTSTNGYLSSTDWNTFNGKQATISATYPITLSGATVGTAFGTTTSWGIGNDKVVYTSHTGVPLGIATSSASFSIGGNAATATKLLNARNIAGVSFDGSASISLTSGSSMLKGNGSGGFSNAANGTDYTLITAKTCTSGDFVSSVTAAGVFTCTTPAGGGTSYWTTGSNNIWNTNSKNVGIGTTTPKALLTLMASSTLPTEKMFSITDSTGASVFSIATSSSASLTVGTMTGLLMAHSGLFYATATSSPVALDISGNAGTATKLATARNIAGVAFDGSANISLNNNAITNGAGYITAITGGTCTNQFVRSLSTAGAPTCATVGASDVSLANLTATNSTLTFSGTYNGSTARTIGLNLGNANTWTALQQFSNASSTQLSAASQKFYVDSTGKITGYDATNAWSGRISPTHNLVLSTATTTAWTATTSGAYINSVAMPFAGTIRTAKCFTNTGTLNVDVYHTSTHLALFNASTTVGTIKFASNNTVTAGEKLYMVAGTPASTPTSLTCTLAVTETI